MRTAYSDRSDTTRNRRDRTDRGDVIDRSGNHDLCELGGFFLSRERPDEGQCGDGTGGLDPSVSPFAPSLDRDLSLTIGRAWVDFGLTLPNWPQMTLGYEYQYKRGDEATLEWGYTAPGGKAVNPASQSLSSRKVSVFCSITHSVMATECRSCQRTPWLRRIP